jgi:hypothetical protein
MDQVNSQRENGPTERENGTKPGYGGQQLKTEKSFVSRGFGREAAVGETVVASAVGGGAGFELSVPDGVKLGSDGQRLSDVGHEDSMSIY